MSDKKEGGHGQKFKKTRSKILYEITVLIVIVVFATGLVTFFLVRASQERLIEKSKDKLFQSEVENISSSFDYIVAMLSPAIIERSLQLDLEDYAQAFSQKQVTEVQEFVNAQLAEMTRTGVLGVEKNLLIINEWAAFPANLLFASSDESLIYEWDVPPYISQAIEDGTPFIRRDEGIPELGLEGEQLLVIKRLEDPEMGYVAGFVGIKPMQGDIAAIESFYGNEKERLSLVLAAVVGGSIVVMIIISFFVLNYLIKKKITEPMDELASAAEQVMEGNLDVEIAVREGGEFEGLSRAFKEMVESFRAFMAKAVGET